MRVWARELSASFLFVWLWALAFVPMIFVTYIYVCVHVCFYYLYISPILSVSCAGSHSTSFWDCICAPCWVQSMRRRVPNITLWYTNNTKNNTTTAAGGAQLLSCRVPACGLCGVTNAFFFLMSQAAWRGTRASSHMLRRNYFGKCWSELATVAIDKSINLLKARVKWGGKNRQSNGVRTAQIHRSSPAATMARFFACSDTLVSA